MSSVPKRRTRSKKSSQKSGQSDEKKEKSIDPAVLQSLGLMLMGVSMFCAYVVYADYANEDKANTLHNEVARYTMGLFMTIAGTCHFIDSYIPLYEAIMPPFLPFHMALIYLSGIAEIISGVLLSMPGSPYLNTIGGYACILTLVAVFPANIWCLFDKQIQRKLRSSTGKMLFRLPLQFLFIGASYIAIKPNL